MDPLPDRIEVTLENRQTEIRRAHELLDHILARLMWPTQAGADLHVALEEHLANIINHGYTPEQSGRISIRFYPTASELRVEIEDDAAPFNPLLAPPVDVTRPIEERPIGGLGIHLLRQLVDGLEYNRTGDRNRFVMRKRI